MTTHPASRGAEAKLESYPLTHPDKVLYPELGLTKRDLLGYYSLVAERMLPHVRGRPLTLVRCPSGRGKPCFFQKHPGEGAPEALHSFPIREQKGEMPYGVIEDEAGLFALVQLGALEVHTWGSRVPDVEQPDILVFDLDPDPAVGFEAVVAAASELRCTFEAAKLETFVKTTGGKGLHVCVPITPELDFATLKDFSRQIVDALVLRFPDRYLASASKAKRRGKIFIDYLRNARGATFVAPYSTRARENAPIALPLEWDELTPALRPSELTLPKVVARLAAQKGDPFARFATLRQSLRGMLAAMQ